MYTIPHFGDIDWYLAAARQALATGRLPVLGITTSITWLHQGPLWTYLLLLPTALGLDPIVFTAVTAVATIVLAYFTAGLVPALILAFLPFSIVSMLTPYHTSVVPLLFFISYLCLIRRKPFWAGLFIGFLYQSHLLTFIYWPLWWYLLYKRKLGFGICGLGFVIGILPFILAGPVQMLGIFVWLAKQLLTGLSGVSSGISTAYWVVLLPGFILAVGWILKRVRGKIRE